MASPGTALTYDLTTGVKLNVENIIWILTPSDVPWQGTYNDTTNLPPESQRAQRSVLADSSGEITNKKFEWQEDTLLTARTTLGATCVTADTFITVASGQRLRFSTGNIVLIDSEHLRITGYGTTTDTLTISRTYGSGETAAQHSNAAVVLGTGTALIEGADPENFRFTDISTAYNITQILGPELIKVSASEQAISLKGGYFGVTNQFSRQVMKKMREMLVTYEQAINYGVRVEDTTNDWRTMGGFLYYITTNVDSTTTAISYTAFTTQAQNAYNNGGMVNTFAVAPSQKVKMSSFDAASIRLARADNIRGQIVDVIVTDFGECDIMLNRHLRTADAIGIDKQWVDLATLRPLVMQPLAKTGDSDKVQLVGEKTMRVRMQTRHFRFSALA